MDAPDTHVDEVKLAWGRDGRHKWYPIKATLEQGVHLIHQGKNRWIRWDDVLDARTVAPPVGGEPQPEESTE